MHSMSNESQGKSAWWKAGLLTFGTAALVAACSSSGGGGATSSASSSSMASSPAASPSMSAGATGSPGASQQFPCTQIKALSTSLDNLTHMQVTTASASQISAQLKTIGQQVTALKSTVGSVFSSQLDQLSTALNQVRAAAQNVVANPSTANKQALTAALDGLKKTVGPMADQLKAVCPQASSSASASASASP